MISVGPWEEETERPVLVCVVECSECNLRTQVGLDVARLSQMRGDAMRQEVKSAHIDLAIDLFRKRGCTHWKRMPEPPIRGEGFYITGPCIGPHEGQFPLPEPPKEGK